MKPKSLCERLSVDSIREFRAAAKQRDKDAAALANIADRTARRRSTCGAMLWKVDPAVRPSDPVTLEQCKDAMRTMGASTVIDPERPQLRFSRLEDAQECLKRLAETLPGSEQVWIVHQELPPADRIPVLL
ncbi:MAG TPA: hypothetical protein VHX65_11450 [Pirellulales bacterium]|jgi:hypothetical protein|nr:hypothetical protein [Pirellulales bacterium]